MKQFIQGVQVTLTTMDCMAILLRHSDPVHHHPEHAMVDGLIALNYPTVGMRAIRELQVLKFLGSDFLEGRHSFQITSEGVVVYPRTEILLRGVPSVSGGAQARARFGVPSLDEMLRGGLPGASTTMLLGVPGSGKTVLGLHFLLAGARADQVGLLFSFNETAERLLRKGNDTGLDIAPHVERGMIEILWRRPVENDIDALAEDLLANVRERKVERLFLDGLNGFYQAAAHPARLEGFIMALTNELRSLGVTTVLTVASRRVFGPDLEVPIMGVTAIMDNIILLRYVELRSQLYRLVSILKARETDYDPTIREFRIVNDGIEVADSFESAEAILTGIARPLPPDTTAPPR
ncbi:MAG: ATPase domain-containing protein, partial [Ardenticatenaceae bacterium]